MSTNYWRQSPQRLIDDWKVALGLVVVLLLVYLPGLGSYGLYDPWETHYGEVARYMVESDNYIDPYWGSPWDPDGVKREREGFYSKPPMIMWLMSAGMEIVGYKALGFRLFFPLATVLALLSIYLSVSRFFDRRAGLIASLLTATTPFICLTSRQAVPDGLLVAIITAGMMSLAYGLFGCKEEEQPSRLLYGFTLGLAVLVMVGQLWIIWPMDKSPDIVRPYLGSRGFFYSIQWWFQETFTVARGKGPILCLLMAPLALLTGLRIGKQKQRRMLYIYLFYIACGLIVPTKGWLGWAPMGGAILGYMLVTGDWKILAKVDVPGGLLIVFMIGHPWVIAMLGGHHPAWYKRFWIHDHINRLFAGVHSLDSGGYEYFIRWLGYGLFPWIAVIPAAVVRIFNRLRTPECSEESDGKKSWSRAQRFEILVLFWAVFSFFLFSKSSTKFHHYILPAVPAITILMGLAFHDLLDSGLKKGALLLGMGALGLLWVAPDLMRMPGAFGQGTQNLVNLFTYKYDREWPAFTSPEAISKLSGDQLTQALAENAWLQGMVHTLLSVLFVALVGFIVMGLAKGWRKRYAACLSGLSALVMTVWLLQVFLPKVAVHWSQEELWNAYYDHCTKFEKSEQAAFEQHLLKTSMRVPAKLDIYPKAWCKEPIVAFRTNWRGENVYSANTVLPAPETKHLGVFLKHWDSPFYVFTERHRVKSELEKTLPSEWKGRYEEIFGRNLKFVLLRLDKSLPKNTKFTGK